MSKVECYHCGEMVEEEQTSIDCYGNVICEDCVENEYFVCEDCGELIPADEIVSINDGYRYVCSDCAENNYYRCEACGGWYSIGNVYTDDYNTVVCTDCFDYNYCVCEDCGRIILCEDSYEGDDGECYCEDCIDYHKNKYIQSYHDVTDWNEHYTTGNYDNTLLKGFELEIDIDDDVAEKLYNLFDDFMVYERDSSIQGFECITHPFSKGWLYKNQDLFKEFCKILHDNGGDSDCCGLHVHVNREQLATTELSDETIIDNIYLIMETFKNELIKFSRRNKSELQRWSSFLLDAEEEVVVDKIKERKEYKDRYRALNVLNRKTIEFRLFKSTVYFDELMAALELVDNIVSIAKENTLDGLTWNDIVDFDGDYIKDYVNDEEITSDKVLKLVRE